MKTSATLYYRFAAVLILLISIFFVGCAQAPTGVNASDGDYADKVVVTWNPERVPEGRKPIVDHYKVFRAEEAEGPYEEISEDIDVTYYNDESATPGLYYYYQVKAYNVFEWESEPSDYDAGYAGNTNASFLQKVCTTEMNAIGKLDTKNPSMRIGTNVTIDGDLSGTCHRAIENYALFWKKIEYTYTNYQDIISKGITLDGTLECIVGINENGFCTGTLNINGDHTGYIDYDLLLTTLQRTGGHYYISQNGHQEEEVDWSPCKSEGGPTADILDQETAKAVLYAAFSGIAYEQESNLIYCVMLGDTIGLSEKVANYVIDSIGRMEIGDLISLGLRLIARLPVNLDIIHPSSGTVFSFTIDPGPASADRTSKDGRKYISSTAKISIDFNSTGYPVGGYIANDRTYYGNGGTYDIVADLEGYFYLDIASLDIDILFTKVNVDLKNSLTISYSEPSEHDISIDQWNVYFDIKYGEDDLNYDTDPPLNVEIVPKVIPIPDYGIDNRDYMVSGSFTVDGEKTYTYDDVRYVQNQIDTDLFINIKGLLGVSGLDGVVLIETLEDITLVDSIWTSGALPFTGVSTADAATFIGDGSVEFSGDLGDWTVENWQEDLNPF